MDYWKKKDKTGSNRAQDIALEESEEQGAEGRRTIDNLPDSPSAMTVENSEEEDSMFKKLNDYFRGK